MSETAQSPSVEQTLNRTDFGHFVYEYRKVLIAAVAAIALGVLGYLGWKEAQKANALDSSVAVFEFRTKTWEEAKAGKIPPAELSSKFSALPADVKSSPIVVPLALEMGKFLFDKGAYPEADSVLSSVDVSKDNQARFFVGLQRYVVLEKLGKLAEAAAILEGMPKQESVFMNAFVGVELGRIYLAQGEKGKAQSQFESVVSAYPNDEHARLAKLYLADMKK